MEEDILHDGDLLHHLVEVEGAFGGLGWTLPLLPSGRHFSGGIKHALYWKYKTYSFLEGSNTKHSLYWKDKIQKFLFAVKHNDRIIENLLKAHNKKYIGIEKNKLYLSI